MLDRTIAYGLDFTFPIKDNAIGANLALYGEFARPIADFLIEHASDDTGLMIDAGANIGAISLPFAAARPGWRVISIEPHRGLSALLSANAVNNRLMNIEVVQACVGLAAGIVGFPSDPLTTQRNFGTLSLKLPTDLPTTPTLMTTLDDLAPDGARLVKMDVEGCDAEALQGSPNLLHKVRPIWLVEAARNQYPQAARDVIQTLLDADYSVHWFFAPWTSRDGQKGREVANIGKGDPNVVALPPGVDNRWNLPRVHAADDPYPPAATDYPYLLRYDLT
jgi:FkbM family methyltransferase